MKMSWRRRGLGAVALLAAAAGCGDDTTGSGGGGGAGTTASTASGATTAASTAVASTGASPGVTSSPASSGSSSEGGGGSGGDGGSTSNAQGGSTSEGGGGSGGSVPECIEITLDEDGLRAVGGFRIASTFSPALGEDDEADALGVGYADEEGDFELDSVINDNFATCEQCVVVLEDGDGTLAGAGRTYFQTGGTMTVTEGSAFPFATVELAGVTLVEVTIDEDGVSEVVDGGGCLTVVDGELELDIPEEWTCSDLFYATGDGCDCNCGTLDPDCLIPDDDRLYGCGASGPPGPDQPTCSNEGECVAPESWTCAADAFQDGEACDCECGAPDTLDCQGFEPLPIDGCDDDGAVCRAGTCVSIPDEWTCDDAAYGSGGVCDCNCGIYDPDCDLPGPVFGCGPDQGCTAEGECGVPAGWGCDDAAYDDGVTCDCECGAVDPDCGLVDPPIAGCEDGEICAADECVQAADNDTCDTAIALTEGTVLGSWVGATNSLDPGADGCTDFPEIGGDVFYTVSLLEGETLTVAIDQVGSPADSALYLVTDCADAGSCVAGIDTNPNTPEQLVYTATADIDLFLVVDQFLDTNQVGFELTVSID